MLTFSELPPPSPSFPNSSTKDSWIKKIYITEYTEYAENINIYTERSWASLIISDHPQVSGWELSLSIVRLMNLLHFRNLMALKVWQNLLIAGALVFQGKHGVNHLQGSKGWISVSWTTPGNWFKLKQQQQKQEKSLKNKPLQEGCCDQLSLSLSHGVHLILTYNSLGQKLWLSHTRHGQ